MRPARFGVRSVGMALAEHLLKVRTRDGRTSVLKANAAQEAFERLRGKHRWHLLFRADGPRSLFRVHRALAPVALRPPGGASVRFDMDPYSMM